MNRPQRLLAWANTYRASNGESLLFDSDLLWVWTREGTPGFVSADLYKNCRYLVVQEVVVGKGLYGIYTGVGAFPAVLHRAQFPVVAVLDLDTGDVFDDVRSPHGTVHLTLPLLTL